MSCLKSQSTGCSLCRWPFPPTHTAAAIFRACSHGSQKNENKRPQPQSDRAGAVQTLFATFYKNSKYDKNAPRLAPQSDDFGCLFGAFFTKVARGVQGHTQKRAQDTNMGPEGTQMEAKGAEMKPLGPPKVPKSLPTIPHVCQNGNPRCHNGAQRPPKVPKRHHGALQSGTKTFPSANNKHT